MSDDIWDAACRERRCSQCRADLTIAESYDVVNREPWCLRCSRSTAPLREFEFKIRRLGDGWQLRVGKGAIPEIMTSNEVVAEIAERVGASFVLIDGAEFLRIRNHVITGLCQDEGMNIDQAAARADRLLSRRNGATMSTPKLQEALRALYLKGAADALSDVGLLGTEEQSEFIDDAAKFFDEEWERSRQPGGCLVLDGVFAAFSAVNEPNEKAAQS